MEAWICVQCGAPYDTGPKPPAGCRICEDIRQFVRWEGQAWTTMPELRRDHRLEFKQDHGVTGIGVSPSFAIGQRALLVEQPDGMVMWDCVPLVTDEAVASIRSRGPVKAIAISHPHFYNALGDWSEALGDVPVYLHEDDREWITQPHKSIVLWSGERHALDETLTLVHSGGHFAGATMMHQARDGGALFAADIAMVAMDRKSLTFMFSYPNYIPLNAPAVRRIRRSVEGLAFERIYSMFWQRNVVADGRGVFDRSVERHIAAISGSVE